MFVGDLMTSSPVVVRCGESLERVRKILQTRRIHQVPVLDESGRLVGIVTDRDIRSALGYGDRNEVLNLTAEDVMTVDLLTVGPDATAAEVVDVFVRRRFGAIPVIANGAMVGIITKHDVLRGLRTLLDDPVRPAIPASRPRL